LIIDFCPAASDQFQTMKVVVLWLVALLGEVLTSALATRSPVEKIVELIEEMKARMEADFKADQKLYDYFACWCETTSDRKAKAITEGKESIEDDSKKILSLKGKVAELSTDVAGLTSDIADNEKDQKEMTELRQKENVAFMAEKTELEQANVALSKALHMLGGMKGDDLLQESTESKEFARLKVMADLRHALQTFPVRDVTVSPRQLALVERFTRSYDDPYSPQSATMLKILKQIYETFTKDLEEKTKEEDKAQKAYEDLIAEKVKSLKHMLEEIKEKNGEKADAEVQLADLSQQVEDTTKQLKVDIEFFDAMKKGCTEKSEEWAERSKAYTGELEGIKEALKILTSDEARELFNKSITPGVGFLQTSMSKSESPEEKAYQVLKEQAAKAKSMRLASVAATLRMAKGHFDEVLKKIDEIIEMLKDEEKDDFKQRDWCKDEYQQNDLEKGEVKWLIEKNEAAIVKHIKIIEKLEFELEETTKQIEETEEQKKAMKKTRKDEKEEFEAAKKDDEDAIDLLGKAKEALTKYYKENEIDMNLLQQPKFEKDPDAMPDATFKKKDANKNESKGIIGLMDIIIEDLEQEISNAEAAEKAAIKEFKKQMKIANELIDTLKEKKVDLEGDITKNNEDKEAEEKDLDNNKEDLKSNEEYRKEITPDCDWLFGAFDERRKMRAQELDGLVKAKEFLAGASLLAKKSQVHQAAPSIKKTQASLERSANKFLHASKPLWLPKK